MTYPLFKTMFLFSTFYPNETNISILKSLSFPTILHQFETLHVTVIAKYILLYSSYVVCV